ncbi:MAG: S26 family signal peptidase [Hyphomicrobiaceae bacterium]
MRAGWIAAIVVVAVISTIISPRRLLFVWNVTPSTPIGFYIVTQAIPNRGDLVVTRLPPGMEALAVSRAMLSANTPVLKPIAALAGDLVCRSSSTVTINGRFAAIARELDRHGRSLPIWRGCRRLSASQIFILAGHPDSFDSRYYGPLDAHRARGVAHPLLTFAN